MMLGEIEAYAAFRKLRWPSDGNPVCPSCGVGNPYFSTTHSGRFICRTCRRHYTATSDTVFRCRKAAYSSLMLAINFVREGKRGSILQASLALGVNQKSAYQLVRSAEAFLSQSIQRNQHREEEIA